MRKYVICGFTLFLCLFFYEPLNVKANFGDLRYEITKVSISGEKITFKGWAFIHRTHNYVGMKHDKEGGHKIMMQAIAGGKVIDTKVDFGDNYPNYNFYCEMYDGGITNCDDEVYNITTKTCKNEIDKNKKSNNCCVNHDDGVGEQLSSCYYEDIAFEIQFDVKDFDGNKNITFKIAASNNDFVNKLNNTKYGKSYEGYVYEGTTYTKRENIYISDFSLGKNESDSIEIDMATVSNKVEFIATTGYLNKISGADKFGVAYGIQGRVYDLELGNIGGFTKGKKEGSCKDPLGKGCVGSAMYAIKVKEDSNKYASPWVEGDKCLVLEAYGSHIKLTGDSSFKVNVKNNNKCKPKNPSSGELNCNDSKIFNSDCESLTVSTDKGSANVKIEQKGTISSVLTPDNIYAGGGFNFGIMYYNTIKWDFVNTPGNQELINAVTNEMNKKIKNYDSYVAGLNVTNLEFGGKVLDGINLRKECTTSSNSNNYYRNELTVSCIFYIPESILEKDGNVNYNTGTNFGIKNKYYTPMDYSGKYNIKAKITGMNRITDSSAISDSSDNNKSWTGRWEDDFENCSINIYSLIKSLPTIYRPIDIYNPFPNRNAGINWYQWYSNVSNKDRLENTYNNLEYTAVLNNQIISEIKKYNKDNNYLSWDSINSETGESSFINDNRYNITRVGDS